MPREQASQQIRDLARARFGYSILRPGQEEAVRAMLDGQDALVVMPTGSGKSAIYQLAALLLPGPTVVISPLIALQRDQLRTIEESGAGEAAAVNSAEPESEQREALEELAEDEVDYLFLAPEQFNHPEVLEQVRAAQPSLLVVDEAHCISEWGHDFRPDYLRLGAVVEALGHPRVLALTATASPPVREEIMQRLGMHRPRVIVQGFDRPNIWLGVRRFEDERGKTEGLLEAVVEAQKPGIVYVSTRNHAEQIAGALTERGVGAAFYHAGLKAGERERAQEAFMAGELEVIVATSAFGLGVDKPNVRFVFHYDISDSVDSYYQEIGRAGRDGEPARAVLFYRPEDLNIHRFFAGGGRLDVERAEQVAEALREHDEPVDPKQLGRELELSPAKVTAAVSGLEEAGAVDVLPTGEVVERDDVRPEEAAQEAVRRQERRREFERSRIEMMRGYAEVWDCRREYLLNYFGQEIHDPCDFCDNCEAGVTVEEDQDALPFPINSRVVHQVWGQGLVQRYEGDKMVVLFDDAGYKTLLTDFVAESGALTAAG